MILTVLFLVSFILFAPMISITPALADTNDTVTIDVNVTETASITVIPDTLDWTGVATGQAGGHENLTVKNAGSLNVSQIYAYVDTLQGESSRPYGSSDPTDFSAGGVLTIRNETNTNYYFAGRIEWNWTEDIPNHDWSNVNSPIAWGYFRNTSNDYVWVLGNGTDGRCNETGAQFSVETQVDLGTQATRTPDNTFGLSSGDSEYAYAAVTSGPLSGSCVAAYQDCSKVYIYKYDQRTSPNFANCGNSAYLQETNLTSGYTFIIRVDPWVPNGIPSGYLNTTTLTVYASS